MTLGIRAAAVILLATSIAGAAFAQERGADVYKAKCVRCHSADGLGATPAAKSMGILSFKDPLILKWSDQQFIDFTTKAYRNNGLSDAQIKDVVAYIRKLQK
ncbi:MAG: cytochrome c [Terracidiphilus sp.]|jgi:mono/diheme cytochrome c family protein